MVVVIVLSIIKKDLLLLVLLSAGVGVEIYLVGFQIWHNTYCVYCLLFGGVLVVQFFINLDWKKKKTVFICNGSSTADFPDRFSWFCYPRIRSRRCIAADLRQGTCQSTALLGLFLPALPCVVTKDRTDPCGPGQEKHDYAYLYRHTLL